MPANPEPVGATAIFDALMQPDAPPDLQRLRALRDSLSGNPDAKTLNDIRAQLDTLLHEAEHRQGEMPPALVMSGIASRIDTAMTKLEEARAQPPIPAFSGPPWLLPALGALCGTLAIGLVVCLAALVAQARSAEESDELRESLGKIRRKLEELASGNRRPKGQPGELNEDTTESLQEISVSVAHLNSSAKEAETLLRASTEATEQRMQGAVAVASQLETWLDQLPARLNAAIARVEGCTPGDLQLVSQLSDQAFLLPDFLSSMQDACNEMRATTEALAEANHAALCQEAPGGEKTPDVDEWAEHAGLATELTHLAFGHAQKLDDIVAELVRLTEALPLVEKLLSDVTTLLPQQIERSAAVAARFETADSQAHAARLKLEEFVETVLPELVAAMGDAVTRKGIAALGAAAEHCERVAKIAADAVADVPESLRDLGETVIAVSQAGATQQAALADATMRLASLAEGLPGASASLVESADVLRRQVARDAKREAVSRAAIAEITAAAQAARADLAAAADAVAAMPEQNDRLAAMLARGEQLLAGAQLNPVDETGAIHQARSEALAGVENAIVNIQLAAERLHAGAQAQEQALARVRRAALTVATLAGADTALDDAASANADPQAHTG